MGQLPYQMTTMGQRPTVTLVSVPCSLQTFTDRGSVDIRETTINDRINDKVYFDFQGPFKGEAQIKAQCFKRRKRLPKKDLRGDQDLGLMISNYDKEA